MALEDVSPALQAQLGPEATTGLLALLETARQEWQTAFAEASAFAAATADKSALEADVTAVAIERFERRLTEEMGGLRGEMHAVEVRLRGEMREGEARLREEMRDLAAELREEGRVNTAALREEMRGGVSHLRIELKEDISSLRAELKEDVSNLRVELKEDITGLRAELKEDASTLRVGVADALGKARVDMMRWSFSLWVGQVVATAAIVAGMFRVFAQ